MVMTTRERRLRDLRADDTLGLYAKDGPTTGKDPQERVSVTIDALNEVTSVLVEELPDDLRSATALQQAVDAAHDAAVAAKVAAAPSRAGVRAASGPRPVAQVVRRTLPPLTDRRPPTPTRAAAAARPERRQVRRLDATGTSRNECVTLQLRPGLATGRLSLDPGWLRRATTTTLSNAITEAFASAYQERDRA